MGPKPVPDGSGSDNIDGFPERTPGEGTLQSEASAIKKTAGDPKQLKSMVSGKHTQARAGVAGMIEQAMDGADEGSKDAALKLAQLALSGGGAYFQFGGFVGEFNSTIKGLNSQIWAESTPKKQREKKKDLQGKYESAKETLRSDSGKVETWLKNPLDSKTVKALFTAGAMPAATPGIFNQFKFSEKEKYEAVKSKIANGDMPAFKDMSEEERKDFLAEHPGMLKYLMGQKEPSKEVKQDILALAVPHVDGKDGNRDGDTVLKALDKDASPEDFAKAFALVGEFGAYAKWAQKHGGLAIPSSKMDYLKNFMGKTAPKLGDIKDYITANEHQIKNGTKEVEGGPGPGTQTVDTYKDLPGFSADKQNTLLRQYADGVLTLSDKDLGGGYDDLPQPIRQAAEDSGSQARGGYLPSHEFKELAGVLSHSSSDLAAGDGLSKELAMTTSKTLAAYDGTPEDESDSHLGDMLELVGRNHEATTEILADEDMPEDYDNREFLKNIYGHEWEDNGKSAAGLTNWIHEAHVNGTDEKLANRAFNGLAEGLTSVGDGGIFKDMMGDGDWRGDGDESATQLNPALSRSLLNATSDHFGEFARQEGTDGSSPLSEAQRVRLMTLMASNPDTGERMSAAVSAWEHDAINNWASLPADERSGMRELADSNARLSTFLDSALINEASERGLDAREAEEARVATIKAGIGIASSFAGLGGPGASVAGGSAYSILGNVISADHIPNPPANVNPEWTAQGGHVTTANGTYLVKALVESGDIEPDEIDPRLKDLGGRSDAEINDAVDKTLSNSFPNDKTMYGDFENEITDSYDADLANFSLKGKDDDQITSFLEDENWGRP